jgi:hypothetical protein
MIELVGLGTDLEQMFLRIVSVRLIYFIDGSPPPTTYNLKSDFIASPSSKAYSFGISREAYQNVCKGESNIYIGVLKRASSKRQEYTRARGLLATSQSWK